MKPSKRRWSKTYEAAEEELLRAFEAKKMHAQRCELDEFSEIPKTNTEAEVELYCVEGSMECTAYDATYPLQAGDLLTVPMHTDLSIQAGFSGAVYYQRTLA